MWLKRSVALLLTAAVPTAVGDVLLIDGVRTASQTASSRPARGTTMARVESSFGAPSRREGPVGEPPITRWEYSGFVVYFEHQHVIHAVARR
jgi:hypothetical protein